jgi:general secretion pathway protein L
VKRLWLTLPDPVPDDLACVTWFAAAEPDAHGQCPPAELPRAQALWLALPAARVPLTELALSAGALRQLRGALAYALEDRLMLDPADAHVVLAKTARDDVHAAASVERAWLARALAVCQAHGIRAAGAAPETLAWRAAPHTGDDLERVWLARWDGCGGFARTGDTAGFALDGGDALTPPLALRLACDEARRQGRAPARLLLETADAAEVDAAAWARMLQCPVQPATLRVDAHAPAINLLQGEFAPRRALRLELGRYRLAAALALAALGVHALGSALDWARLVWQERTLRAEARQIFQATFPDAQAIVDPALQMRRQLMALRAERGYARPGDLLHALDALEGGARDAAGLNYADGRLLLRQARVDDLPGLRARVERRGYRLEVEGGGARLDLTLRLDRP